MTNSHRVLVFARAHKIAAVTVLIECSCGDTFEGDTEAAAIRDWQIHWQIHAEEEAGI